MCLRDSYGLEREIKGVTMSGSKLHIQSVRLRSQLFLSLRLAILSSSSSFHRHPVSEVEEREK